MSLVEAGADTVLVACGDPECGFAVPMPRGDQTPAAFAIEVASDGIDLLVAHQRERHGVAVLAAEPVPTVDLTIEYTTIPGLTAAQALDELREILTINHTNECYFEVRLPDGEIVRSRDSRNLVVNHRADAIVRRLTELEEASHGR